MTTLRGLPSSRGLTDDCDAALASASVAKQYQLGNIRERVNTAWLDAAEQALVENRLTIGILPLRELLSDRGRLAMLRGRGYRIIEPAGRIDAMSE